MLQIHNQPLDYLDSIPDDIYRRLVTHNYRAENALSKEHSLRLRCVGILQIRQHMLNAEISPLKELQHWLDVDMATVLFKKISKEKLLTLTKDNPPYTDSLIIDILDWMDNTGRLPDVDENSSEQGHSNEVKHINEHHSASPPIQTKNTELKTRSDIQPKEQQSVRVDKNKIATNESGYLSEKLEQMLDKDDVENTYSSMKDLNKRFALQRQIGWDLSKGIKSKSDVRQLIKFHRLIKKSKQLQSIIKMIGRRKNNRLDEVSLAGLHQNTEMGSRKHGGLPDEHIINSVTGVYSGDDISRMLPTELLALGHPKLKMLWHAKRADRQLLSYHFQGVSSEHVAEMQPQSLINNDGGKHKALQQGPMVLCLDTSASMKGQPEHISKAVVLEFMRLARVEKRACYLFSFSATNEINEFEFDLEGSGWQPVINFLSFSFHGGTDINRVLQCAVDKVNESNGSKADIVVVSDGLFKIKNKLIESMQNLNSNTRLFGINVSHWNSSSFSDICHQTFTINNV